MRATWLCRLCDLLESINSWNVMYNVPTAIEKWQAVERSGFNLA
jgi:hypothetical protein